MRVLVVDDSAFMRRLISRMLLSDNEITEIQTANDGEEAVQMAKSMKPDVITMDIEMPKMDGLAALRKIMNECPTPVVMCSSLTIEGSRSTFRALQIGAVDFIAKDTSQSFGNIMDITAELQTKVKVAAKARIKKPQITIRSTLDRADNKNTSIRHNDDKVPAIDPAQLDLIVIGSSTGGPPIVEVLIKALPRDLCVPVVVAQHMPLIFTKSLAERLNDHCAVPVKHAENDTILMKGTVYILPGGLHGRVKKSIAARLAFDISEQPLDAHYKPSVNELMASAATACRSRVLGVMLSGMGNDGCIGAGKLVAAGGTLLAQNEETCVVYGMPKAVVEAGFAHACLPPQSIANIFSSIHKLSAAG